MRVSRIDFDERKQETRGYFDFLKKLNENASRLHATPNGQQPIPFPIADGLVKTLKATAFLLLYNLVESTMTDALHDIYDELKNQSVSFTEITDDLKKIVLSNFKSLSMDNLPAQLVDISVDIITVGFRPRELFSGNIDARLIRKTAQDYGFSHETPSQSTKQGEFLLMVKTNRNDLAHGAKSFAEVGKEYSIEQLMETEAEVVSYLAGILDNIERYIQNEEYLETSYRTRNT